MGIYKLSTAGSFATSRTLYKSALAGNAVFVPNYAVGAYDSIATVTVSTATPTITFSSIPSTYTHLQVRCSALTAGGGTVVALRLNSDTGSNYAAHSINGTGTAVQADAYVPESYMRLFGRSVGTSTTSPTPIVADILDYTNTNKYTTMRTLAGCDTNGNGEISFKSGLWMNTNAVTTITIVNNDSSNFSQYSSFALYGIKGA